MPKIPTYDQRASAPRTTGAPLSNVSVPLQDPAARGVSDVAGALGQTSDQFKARMLQRKAESDSLAVSQALTRFRASERDKILPLYQRQGMDAVGDPNDPESSVYGTALKSYDEILPEVTQGLDSDDQRRMFFEQASRIRDAGLSSAATHVAREHQAAKVQAFRGEVDSVVSAAGAGMYVDKQSLEDAITGAQQRADETYPGFDTREQKTKIEQAVLAAYVRHTVNTDPQGAEMALEYYRERLGGQYEALAAPVKAESLYSQARTQGLDFDEAEDWIEGQAGYSRKVRDAAKSLVSADQAEAERRKAEALKERRKVGMNGFYDALIGGELNQAQRVVSGWDPESFTVHDKYLATEMIKRAANPTLKSDPSAERGLFLDVRTGKIKTRMDILADPRAVSLTIEDLRKLEGDLGDANDPATTAQRRDLDAAITALKPMFDARGKGAKDKAMWPLFQVEMINDVDTWRLNHPGKTMSKAEIIEMGMKMLTEKDVPGRWFDASEFDLRAEQRQDGGAAAGTSPAGKTEGATLLDRVGKIPPTEMARIQQSLETSGKNSRDARAVWWVFEKNYPDDAQRIVGGM